MTTHSFEGESWPRRASAFEPPVQLSVLDRLVDPSADLPPSHPAARAESIRALRASVRRHLEWLLNTRRPLVAIPEELEEVRQSLLRFGLPDISSLGRTRATQQLLARAIRETIRQFEPRLDVRDVVVMPPDAAGSQGSAVDLRFMIHAQLRVELIPEGVQFDSVLDLTPGDYRLRNGAEDPDA